MSTFVDTHVLVYAHDLDAGRKHARAQALLRELWQTRDGVLSTQVLQEFYVNVTRKISKPIAKKEARELVQSYTAWRVASVEPGDVLAASDFEERFRLSFWDALIVTSALNTNAETLVSEDLEHGLRIKGLSVVNPFR